MGFIKNLFNKKSEQPEKQNGLTRSVNADGKDVSGWQKGNFTAWTEIEDDSNYEHILNDIYRFRYQGFGYDTQNRYMTDMEKYDSPNLYFFKLFFYFNNDKTTGNLLSYEINTSMERQFESVLESNNILYNSSASDISVNTAMNYLLMNAELERARNLGKFIDLLQEINTKSPWYFQSVGGLDDFLKKDYMFNNEGLSIKDERKQITIKCLADSIDDRIGTLMDLYKSACYSDINKKEIIPANLRKFDMGIYIMSVPTRGLNTFLLDSVKKNTNITPHIPHVYTGTNNSQNMKVSCKYIELLNCEFDPSCTASAYSDVNSSERFNLTYELKISADDIKEDRYNQFLCMNIGDFVDIDMNPSLDQMTLDALETKIETAGNFAFNRTTKEGAINALEESRRGKKDVLAGWPGSPKKEDGYLAKSIKGIIKSGTNYIKSNVEKLLLGNIYKPTLVNKIEMGISALSAPNIQGTVTRGKEIFRKQESKQQLTTTNIYRSKWNVVSNDTIINKNIYGDSEMDGLNTSPGTPNIYGNSTNDGLSNPPDPSNIYYD